MGLLLIFPNEYNMKLFILLTLVCTQAYSQNSSIYNNQFTTLDNRSHTLAEFKGKRIMIVVLPTSKSTADSAILSIINLFGSQNADNVTIIGIPSIEDGYATAIAANFNGWYQKLLGPNIIITAGMNSRKSGAQQHPVLAWLTHAVKNGHFDQDIAGPGQIYFINETGQLYGEVSPAVSITTKILNKILHS